MQIKYRSNLTKTGKAAIVFLTEELSTGNANMNPDELLWHKAGKSWLHVCRTLYGTNSDLNFDRPGIPPNEQRSDLTGALVQIEINLHPVAAELARRGDERYAIELEKIIKDSDRELCDLYKLSASITEHKRTKERLDLYRVAVRETLQALESLLLNIRADIPNFPWSLEWKTGDNYRHYGEAHPVR